MNQDFNAKLNLLIKSEKALFRLEMRRKGRQTLFTAIALLAVLAALALINVTVYLYLVTRFSPLVSAGILSGLNLAIAAIFLVIASRQDVGPEAASLEEIRDFAWEQVSRDLDGVKQQVGDFTDGIKRVSGSINSVMHRDYSALAAMLPFVQTLLAARKKKKEGEAGKQ
ncbi:MAG TPA: hypothetical protein ENJ12_00520 [Thiolapillus brandeum]|uniref:Phage holin family protein n=1 Tax=Thiolapillus brandeum TaxID=1076588 RepID=A0A831RUS2_9GAMM|nr:hypothetical protein [Thiolapillus brandeum]